MRSLVVTSGFLFLAACASTHTISVPASFETQAVASSGDAADDPAVWLSETSGAVKILGTDKRAGLYTYDLTGAIIDYLPVGRLNNVDVRYGFSAGDQIVDIAVASDRTNIALAVFFIDAQTGDITQAPGGVLPVDFVDPYGLCLYQSETALYAFISEDDTGRVKQFQLGFSDGAMSADEVRNFTVGSIAEGCDVDDEAGTLYIAEENVGVWAYSAAPSANDERQLFAPVDNTTLTADAEGVALWRNETLGDQLIVSSQGDNSYVIYDLETGALTAKFEIKGGEIDRTSETDGIAVFQGALPGYPSGLFIAQDDAEDTGGQNFKAVSLDTLEAAILAGQSHQAE